LSRHHYLPSSHGCPIQSLPYGPRRGLDCGPCQPNKVSPLVYTCTCWPRWKATMKDNIASVHLLEILICVDIHPSLSTACHRQNVIITTTRKILEDKPL
jgi:hypothetical protein